MVQDFVHLQYLKGVLRSALSLFHRNILSVRVSSRLTSALDGNLRANDSGNGVESDTRKVLEGPH